MSRRHGVVSSAAGLIPFGHLGWGYRDRAAFLARAAEYIADGLARNQWVEFVGAGDQAWLRAELSALRDVVDVDRVTVSPAAEFYRIPDGTDVVDPQIAVAARVAATENAIRLGYSGFRAVVDATAVTLRPDQRDAFAHFEFLIDQKMAVLPVSALCAYDMSRLDREAASLVCLHPLVDDSAPSFQIYAEDGADFAVAGEVDIAAAPAFTAAVRRVWQFTPAGLVTVDARDLSYIGHQQLLDLERQAAAERRRILFRTDQPVLARLVDLLGLQHISVAAH